MFRQRPSRVHWSKGRRAGSRCESGELLSTGADDVHSVFSRRVSSLSSKVSDRLGPVPSDVGAIKG